MDITNACIQTDNTKKVEDQKKYENQNNTGTDPGGYFSRRVWTLYYILKCKSSAISGVIKIVIHNVNGIITVLPKVEKGSVIHWFQIKSL